TCFDAVNRSGPRVRATGAPAARAGGGARAVEQSRTVSPLARRGSSGRPRDESRSVERIRSLAILESPADRDRPPASSPRHVVFSQRVSQVLGGGCSTL